MVPWYWLVVAAFIGALFALLILAILQSSWKDDNGYTDSNRDHH